MLTVFMHELKRNLKSLLGWSIIVGAFIVLLMLVYPMAKIEMIGITNSFKNMGWFSTAFSIDKLDFSTAVGFFGVEAGTVLLIAGSMFAAVMGISVLSREEYGRTAEFLLTASVSRGKVLCGKLLCTALSLLVFEFITFASTATAFALIGEEMPLLPFMAFYAAVYIMQLQIAAVCFGISAFPSRGGSVGNIAVGIGIALFLYCIGIFSKINANLEVLDYFTPFSYCDSVNFFTDTSPSLQFVKMVVGVITGSVILSSGIIYYLNKDINS